MGQVDDALRHAISKLADIHFAATRGSADRLFRMGEERWRIRTVGAPGIDGIQDDAATAGEVRSSLASLEGGLSDHALLLLHPTDADANVEARRARLLLDAVADTFGSRLIALLPNADPGSGGIVRGLRAREARGELRLIGHVDRPLFLGMMRDCAALVGNSSSGIIEAGSFGTPVLDIGPRQQGRERGANVRHVSWDGGALASAVLKIARQRRTRVADNPYQRGGAGRRIANVLADVEMDDRLRRKVIRY